MKEAEKQLSDENVYWKVEFMEKMTTDLVETSNRLFKNLKTKGCISETQIFYLRIYSNILLMNLKNLPAQVNCTCYLKFIKSCLIKW